MNHTSEKELVLEIVQNSRVFFSQKIQILFFVPPVNYQKSWKTFNMSIPATFFTYSSCHAP
jgi:hypothetical protein